jgi:dGTPase
MHAVKMLRELFRYCLLHPRELGTSSKKSIKKIGLHRAVCDYIAGMTDRYVMIEHGRIFGENVEKPD